MYHRARSCHHPAAWLGNQNTAVRLKEALKLCRDRKSRIWDQQPQKGEGFSEIKYGSANWIASNDGSMIAFSSLSYGMVVFAFAVDVPFVDVLDLDFVMDALLPISLDNSSLIGSSSSSSSSLSSFLEEYNWILCTCFIALCSFINDVVGKFDFVDIDVVDDAINVGTLRKAEVDAKDATIRRTVALGKFIVGI